MKKIVVLDGGTENPGDLSWEALGTLGELTVYDATLPEMAASRIGEAEIVLTNKVPVKEEVISACPRLEMIGVLATGFNIVDTEAARRRGIPVCNVPGYGTDSVAQFTMAMLLEICSKVGLHSEAVHRGEWQKSGSWCFCKAPLMELRGKTMGIIGLGSIGKATARLASAFGMKVIAASPHPTAEGAKVAEYVPFPELLARSDVIALHCPLTEATRGLINRSSIGRMKPGVILLNSARGALIVENDLAEALADGRVAAAAVDVVTEEPIREENPLLHAPNCLITPHIAWAARESRRRLMEITVENVRAYLAGQP